MEISASNNIVGSSSDYVQPVKVVSDSTSNVLTEGQQATVASSFPTLTALKQTENTGGQITISDQQVLRAIEKAIKAVEGTTTSLQFSVHQRTKHISVKVMNKETGEVIREIPPEKNLDFLANLWEKAGILVDERR